MIYNALNPSVIAIHSAATKPGMDIDKAWITREHIKRGFSTIGYHYFICRDGRVEEGRPYFAQGAHVKGHNHYSLGICMAGGIDNNGDAANNFTTPQWGSLAELVAILLRDHNKLIDVCGHRDFLGAATDCPSFDVRKWVQTHTLLINLLERNNEYKD